jgi:hypothetical protein
MDFLVPALKQDRQEKNEAAYDKDMDATRCILYFHGGENFLF